MRAGLDRAATLVPGTGYAELTAGVARPWGEGLEAYARIEAGWRPLTNLSAFAFGEATLQGASAGIGARLTW